jgi:hypothetical protein
MTGAGKFDWSGLPNWHTATPALDRLVVMDRELDDRQRTVALDLALVTLRTARFYAAVAVPEGASPPPMPALTAFAVRSLRPRRKGEAFGITAGHRVSCHVHRTLLSR